MAHATASHTAAETPQEPAQRAKRIPRPSHWKQAAIAPAPTPVLRTTAATPPVTIAHDSTDTETSPADSASPPDVAIETQRQPAIFSLMAFIWIVALNVALFVFFPASPMPNAVSNQTLTATQPRHILPSPQRSHPTSTIYAPAKAPIQNRDNAAFTPHIQQDNIDTPRWVRRAGR
jgi:hypothetical protein